MTAPILCPECLGRGWKPYFVETVEGEEEMAWELCPDCGSGQPFPPLARGAGTSSAKAFLPQQLAEAVWSSSRSESSIETSTGVTDSALVQGVQISRRGGLPCALAPADASTIRNLATALGVEPRGLMKGEE